MADNYVHMVETTGRGDIREYPRLKSSIDVFADAVGDSMIENARRLHPECRFSVGSATDLDLGEASLGGLLGWWSLFSLPGDVLPQVLALFARALKPGGHFITGTHVGDEDVRTEAYGGVHVRWTTHKWRPDQLVAVTEQPPCATELGMSGTTVSHVRHIWCRSYGVPCG